MEVKLYDNCLTVDNFNLLRNSARWNTVPKLQIEQSLVKGLYSVAAKDGDKVVGMGRLVGDGIMYWYINRLIFSYIGGMYNVSKQRNSRRRIKDSRTIKSGALGRTF